MQSCVPPAETKYFKEILIETNGLREIILRKVER
jgi:hypothetical protein